VHKILIADGARGLGEILTAAREQGIPIQTVRRTTLDRQARQVNHQGVAAMAAAHAYAELADVLARAEDSGEPPFLVALHEVQDPHNLGSILRTADAAGVHGVLIGRHRAVGLTPSVARTSAGAIEHVPVVRVANLARTLLELKSSGYWVVGTDADGEHDYRKLEYDHPLVLVVGGEDRGLGKVVAAECDWIVRLPMRGHLNSLNASVAAAICIYEVFARRSTARDGS
jgi:23S rRNA (guanosine2251-2'-O)-methyltransferase